MSNPFTITDEMVSDILVAAFEGGINYWAESVNVVGQWPEGAEYASDVLTRGGSLRVKVQDDDTYLLTLAKFKKGLKAEAARRGKTPLAFYEDHDAEYADCAVQMALFGEIVYG